MFCFFCLCVCVIKMQKFTSNRTTNSALHLFDNNSKANIEFYTDWHKIVLEFGSSLVLRPS